MFGCEVTSCLVECLLLFLTKHPRGISEMFFKSIRNQTGSSLLAGAQDWIILNVGVFVEIHHDGALTVLFFYVQALAGINRLSTNCNKTPKPATAAHGLSVWYGSATDCLFFWLSSRCFPDRMFNNVQVQDVVCVEVQTAELFTIRITLDHTPKSRLVAWHCLQTPALKKRSFSRGKSAATGLAPAAPAPGIVFGCFNFFFLGILYWDLLSGEPGVASCLLPKKTSLFLGSRNDVFYVFWCPEVLGTAHNFGLCRRLMSADK